MGCGHALSVRAGVVGLATAVGACSGWSGWSGESLPIDERPGLVRTLGARSAERVALLDECPIVAKPPEAPKPAVAPIVATIAVGLVPVAADLVKNAIFGALQRAREDLSAAYVATGATERDLGSFHCLVVARGEFGTAEGTSEAWQASLESRRAELQQRIGLARSPDFYFEAWLERDAETGRTTLTPVLLHFRSSKASRGSRKNIGMALAFATKPLQQSTEKATEGAAVVVPVEFADVAEGSEYRHDPALPMPQNPLWDQARVVDLRADNKPLTGRLNLVALVSESETPGFLFTVIEQALLENKVGIESLIQSTIKAGVLGALCADPKQRAAIPDCPKQP